MMTEISEPVTVTRSWGGEGETLFGQVTLGSQDEGNISLRCSEHGLGTVIRAAAGGSLGHPHHLAGERAHGRRVEQGAVMETSAALRL